MADIISVINKNLYFYTAHYIKENGFEVDDNLFSIVEERGAAIIVRWDYVGLKKPSAEDLLSFNLKDVTLSAENERLKKSRDAFRASPDLVFYKELILEMILARELSKSLTAGPPGDK